MNTTDCPHTALRIEPDRYRCSGCGTEFERKPAAQHIAEMRELLKPTKPRKVDRVPPTAS